MKAKIKKLAEEYISLRDAGQDTSEIEAEMEAIPTEDGGNFKDKITGLYAQMESDPEVNRQKKISAFADNIGVIGEAAVNIGNIIASISQIKKSNKGLKELKSPQAPSAPKKNLSLQQALNEARVKSAIGLDPRIRAGLESQNIQAAQAADRAAQTASTGQAAQYGAYAQGNYLNRLRNNLQITAAEQDAMNQALQREDALRGQSMQEDQQAYENQWRQYAYVDVPNWKDRLDEFATLGAAGRQNLNASLNALPGTFSKMANTYGALRKQFRPQDQRELPLEAMQSRGMQGGITKPNFFNITPR